MAVSTRAILVGVGGGDVSGVGVVASECVAIESGDVGIASEFVRGDKEAVDDSVGMGESIG